MEPRRSNRNVRLSRRQREQLDQLGHCAMHAGAGDSRFVRSMSMVNINDAITVSQAELIDRLHHRYRRQIAAAMAMRSVRPGASCPLQ